MKAAAPAYDPLTRETIGATIAGLGLLSTGTEWDCAPLTGGISSDIWRVDIGDRHYCLKRALPRLKAVQVWEAPVARNAFEWKWLKLASSICSDSVPDLVAHDPKSHLFVMGYLDRDLYPLWKDQLSRGIVEDESARAVATRLVEIHNVTAGNRRVAREFQTDDNFHAIRMEPYLIATGRVHIDLAERLSQLVRVTLSTKLALVHGDVSPKNILIGPRGPVFLDAECAWYGDPAFDLAFCLNHLLLKCLWQPDAAQAFLAAFDHLAETYLCRVTWEPRASIEARVAHLLPGLFLARVDGKSPVEYITDDVAKDRVRGVARPLISRPVDRLRDVQDAWAKEVLHG